MSMGYCTVCDELKKVTKAGLIYKHGDCKGGGELPGIAPSIRSLVEDGFKMEEAIEPVRTRKTGYTDADLEEMLADLTPRRQKLRERFVAWMHRRRGCCD